MREWTIAKLVWPVKLIAELEPGVASETEVARIERYNFAVDEAWFEIGLFWVTRTCGNRRLSRPDAGPVVS